MKQFQNQEDTKYYLIGVIVSVLFLMIPFILYYEYFFQRKYYQNRILLIKLLKDKMIILKNHRKPFDNIDEYEFDYDDKLYNIWIYNNNKVTLSEDIHKKQYDSDLIGLFIGSLYSKIQNKRLINLIKKHLL